MPIYNLDIKTCRRHTD